MAVTLLAKLKALRVTMENQHVDIIQALNEKGVVVSALNNASIAAYIRQIYQSEWEFFFNFKDVDQFGQPHTLQSGQSTGGLTVIKPYMLDTVVQPMFDMTHVYVPSLPVEGAFGFQKGLSPAFLIEIADFVIEPDLQFKDEQVISEDLNYYEDTLT